MGRGQIKGQAGVMFRNEAALPPADVAPPPSPLSLQVDDTTLPPPDEPAAPPPPTSEPPPPSDPGHDKEKPKEEDKPKETKPAGSKCGPGLSQFKIKCYLYRKAKAAGFGGGDKP